MPFLFAKMTQAQALNDSLYVRELTRIMVENYTNAQYSQAPIYNGKVYRPDLKLDGDGHTLFYDSRYTTGTVIYNGLTYNNIMLLYDLVLDQLVLLNLDKAGGIMIPSDHIDEFSLHNHTFINLKPGKTQVAGIDPGYYDLLYSGTKDLLVKRTKKITETIGQHKVVRTVSQRDKYYLLKDTTYIPVKSKNDFLKQLSETRQQNQLFIKQQRLNFRKEKENSMVELLKFHDSLNR
ncbi:hypothetical protein [Pseudopedobacter saltans]|nr:hypothetical protein [Pseudopedobacter saltans]